MLSLEQQFLVSEEIFICQLKQTTAVCRRPCHQIFRGLNWPYWAILKAAKLRPNGQRRCYWEKAALTVVGGILVEVSQPSVEKKAINVHTHRFGSSSALLLLLDDSIHGHGGHVAGPAGRSLYLQFTLPQPPPPMHWGWHYCNDPP